MTNSEKRISATTAPRPRAVVRVWPSYLTFTLLLLCFSTASASLYYISESGFDSNSGLNSVSPWKTLDYALSQTTFGDQLIFLGKGDFNLSSNAPLWIDLIGAGTELTTIYVSGSTTGLSVQPDPSGNTRTTAISNLAFKTVSPVAFQGVPVLSCVSSSLSLQNVTFYISQTSAIVASNCTMLNISQTEVSGHDNAATAGAVPVRIDNGTTAVLDQLYFHDIIGFQNGSIFIGASQGLSLVTVRNSTFNNIQAAVNTSGAAISVQSGNINLYTSTFSNNIASGDLYGGGAIALMGAALAFISDCSFSNNQAASGGALLIVYSTNVQVVGSNFSFNSATHGGGVYAKQVGLLVSFDSCRFSDNNGVSGGGGLAMFYSIPQAVISNSIFTRNSAPNYIGGSILVESVSGYSFSIYSCSFYDNYAIAGGGIAADYSNIPFSITNSDFEGSHVDLYGGAAYFGNLGSILAAADNFLFNNTAQVGGGFFITDCLIADLVSNIYIANQATYIGGAVAIVDISSETLVVDSEFLGNLAVSTGGALYLQNCAGPTLDNLTFTNNVVDSHGGGLAISNAPVNTTIANSVFFKNYATAVGGGLYIFESTTAPFIYVVNSTFTENTAQNALGGGLAIDIASNVVLLNCDLTGNTAANGGGAGLGHLQSLLLSNVSVADGTAPGEVGGIVLNTISDVHIQNLLVANNTSPQYAGLAAFVTDSLSITNSIFVNNSGALAPALTVGQIGSLVLQENAFVSNIATDQNVVFLNYVSYASIDYNNFSQNYAPRFSSLSILDANVSMTFNSFYNNTFAFYANSSNVIITREPQYGETELPPPLWCYLEGNEMRGTTVLLPRNPQWPRDPLVGVELLIQRMNVTIAGNTIYSKYNKVPSMTFFLSNVTFEQDRFSTAPALGGIVIGGSNVELYTDLSLLPGHSLYTVTSLDEPDVNQIVPFAMNGHSLTITNAAQNWFQNLNATNGYINIDGGLSTMCCEYKPSDWPLDWIGLAFADVQLLFLNRATVYWTAALQPVVFTGDSAIGVLSGSFFYANTISPLQLSVPYLIANESSNLLIVDLTLTGNVSLFGSEISLYPSYYNNRNHSLTVQGDFNIQQSSFIELWPPLALPPFSPVLSLREGPSTALVITGMLVYPSTLDFVISPGSVSYNWIIVQNQLASLIATPYKLQAMVSVDNSLQSLNLEYPLPYTLPLPLDCVGFIDFENNAALDFSTLQCMQVSPTLIKVSSATLSMALLSIDPNNTLATTYPFPTAPPTNPVSPVPLIQPVASSLACGYVALDASHSSGVGSFPGFYYWSLAATDDAVSAAAIQNILNYVDPSSAQIVELPTNLFMAGHTYNFSIYVVNAFGMTSEAANVSFAPTSNLYLPPLTLDGPSVRQYFTDIDVVLTGSINVTGCSWQSSMVAFQWFESFGESEVALNLPASTSPSLLLPSSWFGSSQANHTLVLRAYPAGSSSSSSTAVSTSVAVTLIYGARPLSAISTSRSTFATTETVTLAVAIKYYDLFQPNVMWSVQTCPRNYFANRFESTSAYHGNLVSQTNATVAASDNTTRGNFDCVTVDDTPYLVPFSVRSGLQTTIQAGILEVGYYEILATVTSPTSPSNPVIVTLPLTITEAPSVSLMPPKVLISLPSIDAHQPTDKLVLSAIVDGVQGTALAQTYSFSWSCSFGNLSISTASNYFPTLVLTYADLLPNQIAIIQVNVTSLSTPAITTTAYIQVPFATAPSGGYLAIYPTSGIAGTTTFTVTASDWKSPFWPLRYVFSYLRDDGVEIGIVDLSYQYSYKDFTLDLAGVTPAMVTVIVRVLDGIGGLSTLTVPVNLAPASGGSNVSITWDDIISSKNASNWRALNSLMTTSLLETLSAAQRSMVVDWMGTVFGTSVAKTTQAMGTMLSELNDQMGALGMTIDQVDSTLSLLAELVTSNNASFGTNSSFTLSSSHNLISTLATVLSAVDSNGTLTKSAPLDTIRSHGLLLLGSLYPGEPPFVSQSTGLGVAAHHSYVTGSSSLQAGLPSSPIVEVKSTDLASYLTDGFIGYHFVHYSGTFPYLGSNYNFTEVVDLDLVSLSAENGKKRVVSDISVTRSVTFNTSGTTPDPGLTAQCATFNKESSSFETSGCHTDVSSSSQTSCSCTSLGPLTVIFALPNAESSSSKWWIPLVVVILVVSAVVVGLVVFGTKTVIGRKFFSPFSSLLRNGSLLESSDSSSTSSKSQVEMMSKPTQGWRAAAPPRS